MNGTAIAGIALPAEMAAVVVKTVHACMAVMMAVMAGIAGIAVMDVRTVLGQLWLSGVD